MLTAAWNTFVELAPWLLLGAAVAGLLQALLPPGLLGRRLSGRGGVAWAVALGVPLPLCSCGVIPTGLGLKKQGAGDGATIGFLISTPQTGVDSVLVTAAMLGWPFALFKLSTAAATGLVGGWIADAVAKTNAANNNGAGPDQAADRTKKNFPQLTVLETTVPPTQRWRDGLAAADELLRSIWLWIVVGVVISAGIAAVAPADGLADLSGRGGLLGMLAALVVSLPLYVCATASVPIAASLVTAGLPAGAAIVFLMAGPASNVAALGAVYRTLGGRQLAVYLATVVTGSIAGGLLFGWLIDPAAATQSIAVAPHQHGHPWWATASGVVLTLLFVRYAIASLRSGSNPHTHAADSHH